MLRDGCMAPVGLEIANNDWFATVWKLNYAIAKERKQIVCSN